MLRTTNSQFRRTARRGFTLVEMMVMAAIVVIIMAVLASVFRTGIDAMRQVRAAGDMMDQLRATTTVLRQDLQADHFSSNPVPGQGNERRRVSDYRFDQGATGPSGGFFKIYSPGSTVTGGSTADGVDRDNIQSTRATAHQLHFTSVLAGGQSDKVFTANVGGITYSSPAAEIAYFLVPDQGQYTDGLPGPGNPNSQQLHKLVRRQRLIAMTSADASSWPTSDQEVISVYDPPGPPPPTVNMLKDLVNTTNRLNVPTAVPANPTSPLVLGVGRVGDDILLSNVLSFEVKVVWIASGQTNPGATAFSPGGKTDHPFDDLSANSNTFDTGSSPTIRVQALQVRLRVFDAKMKMTRQASFIVDL